MSDKLGDEVTHGDDQPERNVVTYTIVCDSCGGTFDSVVDWLDKSHKCMPQQPTHE